MLWAFSRGPWITVAYRDPLAGDGVALVRGAEWSAELAAVALLLLAGTVGLLTLRSVARRVVGAVCALAAAGAAISPVSLLVKGADPERIHAILTSGADASAAGQQGLRLRSGPRSPPRASAVSAPLWR
ncbi:Trp biosynthesis-associated membrane protein [Corynebacterium aquatimens]|uniref:Trp biosynthesis-associated membrane protein n=1 Tax=Corynebacterium aquatimens TaxID=1190508 RepID=UPI0025425184|nr:Trp biosynthesis-associated membrane protein [Corynebacterium aquatimens]